MLRPDAETRVFTNGYEKPMGPRFLNVDLRPRGLPVTSAEGDPVPIFLKQENNEVGKEAHAARASAALGVNSEHRRTAAPDQEAGVVPKHIMFEWQTETGQKDKIRLDCSMVSKKRVGNSSFKESSSDKYSKTRSHSPFSYASTSLYTGR